MISVADTLKDDAAGAVANPRSMDVEVIIDRVPAEVLPQDKIDEVRRPQGEGRIVAMVVSNSLRLYRFRAA